MEAILGQNRLEDVSWLCSLSESELDMLISIKKLVLQRARMIGCDELAQKFDLKMLRALAFVLMECVKDKVKDLSLSESTVLMESCSLLKHNLGNIMSLEEIKACLGIDSRKGPMKRLVVHLRSQYEETTQRNNTKSEETEDENHQIMNVGTAKV